MTEKTISVEQQARYVTFGQPGPKTERYWLVFHGYGQLSRFFIRHFDWLDPETDYVVAPQATHKFYLQGHEGRVGSSWMTREDRELDMANYLDYIAAVDAQEYAQAPQAKRVLLGFSQGASTVVRWAARAPHDYHALCLWAGSFPPEVRSDEKLLARFQKGLTFTYGEEDELISPDAIAAHIESTRQLGLPVEVMAFKGGHRLDEATLKRFFAQL